MFLLFMMMGCFEQEKQNIDLVCTEVRNLEREVLKQKLYPDNRSELSCYDFASGAAFVDGYLQAVDKSWSDVFYAAGDVKASQMPALAEPIVGSWVWFYPQCQKEKEQALGLLKEGTSKIMERIEAHLVVCSK